MSKKIVVEIDENGEVVVETQGFKGKSCIKETEWIKELLGKRISRSLSPAYFMTEKDTVKKVKHLNLCG